MTTENKHGFYAKQGLTPAEITEIEQLAQLCNVYEEVNLKLNWDILRSRSLDETNDFLYYEHDRLIGFLGVYSFTPKEAEISGMIHPEYRRKGIFTLLLNAAWEECQRRSIASILLIVEHASASGQAFTRAQHITHDHSEYKMVLEEARIPSHFDEQMQFREARVEDIPVLIHITALAFDLPEEGVHWYTQEVLQQLARRYYVGVLNNVIIGKIDVSLGEREALIYGFGVLPEYRGRGYGRQILARTIQAIQVLGQPHIALEVVTVNKNALTLYQSCGFRETSSYDYYSLLHGTE